MINYKNFGRGLGATVRTNGGFSVLLAALLAACSQGADLSGIAAERQKPVQRYDTSQAIAANGQSVVVGTQSGSVLVSADQASTWQRQQLGTTSLVDIAVCPDKSYVAIDHYHKVWFAGAEGSQWKSVALDKPRTPLAVSCDPQGAWWVAGVNSTIAGSHDQGKTWQVTEFGEDTQITSIQFVDGKHGFALGEFGFLVRSDDGGASWKKGPSLPGEFYPYAALFRDAREGWVSGIAGQMLHTRDGGQSWQKQLNGTQTSLNRLFMHDGVPFAVGNGGVVASLDGDSWRAEPYPDQLPMFLGGAASLPGQKAIVIGGPGGLLRAVGTAQHNK